MIEMPKRSVTRFFIPLLDVMTLLFCMFLLMPLVEPSDGSQADGASEANVARLQREVDRLRKKLESEDREKFKALKKLLIYRVLELDGDTGKLFYFGPERTELNAVLAESLVGRDVREHGVGRDELVYMIFRPPISNPGHPTAKDKATFASWFKGVDLRYDMPGEGGKGERKP